MQNVSRVIQPTSEYLPLSSSNIAVVQRAPPQFRTLDPGRESSHPESDVNLVFNTSLYHCRELGFIGFYMLLLFECESFWQDGFFRQYDVISKISCYLSDKILILKGWFLTNILKIRPANSQGDDPVRISSLSAGCQLITLLLLAMMWSYNGMSLCH